MRIYNINPLIRKAMNETKYQHQVSNEPAAAVIRFDNATSMTGLSKRFEKEGYELHGLIDENSKAGFAVIPCQSFEEAQKLQQRMESAKDRFNEALFEELGNTKEWLSTAREHFNLGIQSMWDTPMGSNREQIRDFLNSNKSTLNYANQLNDSRQEACDLAETQTVQSMTNDLATYLHGRFGQLSPASSENNPAIEQAAWKKLVRRCIDGTMASFKDCNLVQPVLFQRDLDIFNVHHFSRVLRCDFSVNDSPDYDLKAGIYEFRIDSQRDADQKFMQAAGNVHKILRNSDCNFDVLSETTEPFQGVDFSYDPKMTIDDRLSESNLMDFADQDRREDRVNQVSIAIADYVQSVLTLQANNAFEKSLTKLAEEVPGGPSFDSLWVPLLKQAKSPFQKLYMDLDKEHAFGM